MSTKNTIDNLLTIAPAVISDEKTRKDLIDHPDEYASTVNRDCFPVLYSFAQLLKDAYEKENTADGAGLFKLIKKMRKDWLDNHSDKSPSFYDAADYNVYYTGYSILKDRSKKDYKGCRIIPESEIYELYKSSYTSMKGIIEDYIKKADLNNTVEIEAPRPAAVVASEGDYFSIGSQSFRKDRLLPILRALPGCKIFARPDAAVFPCELIKFSNETADAYLLPVRQR